MNPIFSKTLLAVWHFTVLDEPARIQSPEYFLLFGAVLLLGAILVVVTARRLATARAMVPARLTEKVLPGYSAVRPVVRVALSAVAIMMLSLSLTQPQCGVGTETVHRSGIDLIVVFDASRSMLANDIPPSRFERAKIELAALLEELQGDRFGLVAFAATPIVQTPLTTDRRAAAMYLRALHPNNMPRQGTNIGAGLRAAHRMMTEGPRSRSQVVLLISDGEDHHGDAREVATNLAADGIDIFTVGIGSEEGSVIDLSGERTRQGGVHRDRSGDPVISRLDEELLRDIARIGQGSYVNTRGRGIGVMEVMAAIRGMEQDEREVVEIVQYADQSIWLLFPGFLLLVGGALLRPGRPARKTRAAVATGAALFFLLLPVEAEARRLLESQHPMVSEGNRAYAEGNYDAALEAYESALAEELDRPQRAALHYNRGTALAAKGDIEAARADFQASMALGSPKTQARDYYNLGTALLQTGDPKGAVEALIESLRREPGNRAAQHNLELALRALSEPPPDGHSGEEEGDGGDPDESRRDESEESEDSDPDGEDESEDDQQDPEQDEEGEGEGESEQGSEQDEEGQEDEGDPDSDESGDDEEQREEQDEGEAEDESAREEDPSDDEEGEGEDESEREEDPSEDDEGEDDSDREEDGESESDSEDRSDESQDEEREDRGGDDSEEQDGEERESEAMPEGEGDEEDEMAGGAATEQVEIGEQDVEAILDALQARERPLQPFLFRPPAELETLSPDGEDW